MTKSNTSTAINFLYVTVVCELVSYAAEEAAQYSTCVYSLH